MTSTLVPTLAVTLLTLAQATIAHAAPPVPEADLFLPEIELRPGVTAEIHLRVHQKPGVPCKAGTVLAIHGANSTARSLEPLALELVSRPPGGKPVCRVLAMDLPGHGQSSLPSGALFGELTIEDYAGAVTQVLDRLDDDGIRPHTIVGHSMGGLVVQMTQQALLDEGSSLDDAFGIDHAVLLAPAIPASVDWTFRDATDGPQLIAAFLAEPPGLGPVVDIPPEVFVAVVFTKLDGTLASNAMTPAEVAASGWVNAESFTASGSMLGLLPGGPDVDPGIFDDALGTRLDVVAFQEDTIIAAEDLGPLFTYLTGEPEGPGFSIVQAEIATHGLPQTDPAFMLDALQGAVSFP